MYFSIQIYYQLKRNRSQKEFLFLWLQTPSSFSLSHFLLYYLQAERVENQTGNCFGIMPSLPNKTNPFRIPQAQLITTSYLENKSSSSPTDEEFPAITRAKSDNFHTLHALGCRELSILRRPGCAFFSPQDTLFPSGPSHRRGCPQFSAVPRAPALTPPLPSLLDEKAYWNVNDLAVVFL